MDTTTTRYVGFWARFLAFVIDSICVLLLTVPLMFAVYGQATSPTPFALGDILINIVLPAVAVIALWIAFGATPGKMALGATIVDADSGAPLTLSKAVVRYLGYFLSIIPLCAGFAWIAFDKRKQGWHDKLANSVVVRPAKKPAVSGSSPAPGAPRN